MLDRYAPLKMAFLAFPLFLAACSSGGGSYEDFGVPRDNRGEPILQKYSDSGTTAPQTPASHPLPVERPCPDTSGL